MTLEWWTVASEEYSEEAQRGLVEQFEAEHPNIKVDMSIVPDFDTKMTTALGAGQGAPDVAFFWLAEWQPQALDLRPFIERDDFDIDMYFKGNFDSWSRLGDEIIGLPLGVGANFVMYNKDVFDEAGIDYPTGDWTTEDYIEMASQLADEEKKRWGGDRPRGAYRAIWMNHGAKPYSDDSTTVEGYLNGPESVAAYTWLWDLVNSNSTPTPAELEVLASEFTGPVELFLADRIGMATLNNGHMLTAVDNDINLWEAIFMVELKGVISMLKGQISGCW